MKDLTKVEHLIPLKRRIETFIGQWKAVLMRFDLWMKMELSIAKKQYRTETDIPGTGRRQRQVILLKGWELDKDLYPENGDIEMPDRNITFNRPVVY